MKGIVHISDGSTDQERQGMGLLISDGQGAYVITSGSLINLLGGEQQLQVNGSPASVIAYSTEDWIDLAVLRTEHMEHLQPWHLQLYDQAIGEAELTYPCSADVRDDEQVIPLVLKQQQWFEATRQRQHLRAWIFETQANIAKGAYCCGASVQSALDECIFGLYCSSPNPEHPKAILSIESLKHVWNQMPSTLIWFPATSSRQPTTGTGIEIFISNMYLGLNHQLYVDSTITGVELGQHVHKLLGLKNNVAALGGRMGLQFSYRLRKDNRAIDGINTPLTTLEIHDGAQIELQISVAQVAGIRPPIPVDYRAEDGFDDIIPSSIKKRLLTEAFAHLRVQER